MNTGIKALVPQPSVGLDSGYCLGRPQAICYKIFCAGFEGLTLIFLLSTLCINTYRRETHSYLFLSQQTKRRDGSRRFSSVDDKIDLTSQILQRRRRFLSSGFNLPGSCFLCKIYRVFKYPSGLLSNFLSLL